jgi:hypothetical protein
VYALRFGNLSLCLVPSLRIPASFVKVNTSQMDIWEGCMNLDEYDVMFERDIGD